MKWTKESVEKKISESNLVKFIEDNGVLPLRICDTLVLFYACVDDEVEVYYAYPPYKKDILPCVTEFCQYAIPFLRTCLREHRDKNLCTPYCIKPITISF